MRSLILEIPRRILRVTSDVKLEVATIDPKEIYKLEISNEPKLSKNPTRIWHWQNKWISSEEFKP